jgi:hypothetical protein
MEILSTAPNEAASWDKNTCSYNQYLQDRWNICSIEDYITTSSIEKARTSYSPNPSKSEFTLGCCGISQLIPMFSMKLFLNELSWGSLKHPNTWDKTSLEGDSSAEIASRYTLIAADVL